MKAIIRFYRDGLGFTALGTFEDHDGFDGAMLGHPGAPYHLEFTHKAGHVVARAPTDDHLLVFFLPVWEEWERATRRIEALGLEPVPAFNPYWDRQGRTYSDPDGYRVVLQHGRWPGLNE